MYYITPNFAPNFTALRRAQYNGKNANGETKPITLYELEPKDLPYVEKFMDNFKMSDDCAAKKDAHDKQEIMKLAFNDATEICKQKQAGNPDFDKTRMFMAFDGDKSCGLMMCSIPKRNSDADNEVHYSSRQKSKPDETELDWLATWTSKGGETLSKVGKALCNELYVTSEKDNFNDIFVQSEIPEEGSDAHMVYNHLGFRYFGPRRTMGENFFFMPLLDRTSVLNDKVIPMHIKRDEKLKQITKITNDLNRTNLDNASVNLDTLA